MDDDGLAGDTAGDVADVTNSGAFLTIETLSEQGKLVEDRAILLKARYKELHDRVLQIYSNDGFLLKRARQLRKELDSEKKKVEECGEVAVRDDATIKQLKKELADKEQQLALAQEKESILQVEALELDRKRQTLTHDVDESIAQEEAKLKPLIEAHSRDITQLGEDIKNTATQYENLKKQRQALLDQESQIKDDIEKQNAIMYELTMEKARIEKEPERAKKQADIVFKAVAKAQRELGNLTDKYNAQEAQRREYIRHGEELEKEHMELTKTLDTNNQRVAEKKKLVDFFRKQKERGEKREKEFDTKRRLVEEELKAKANAINAERKALDRTLREKDEGMKLFKKLEQGKADLHAEIGMLKKQQEILTREEQQLDSQRKVSRQELDDLKRDVDILINNFLKEEISEKRYVADKEQMHKLIRDMEDEVAQRAVEEQELRREASALSIRREQMSRDCSRNQGKVQLAESEWKVKEVILLEFNKRLDDLKARLTEVVEHWHRVKRERSAKAQMIQNASQTMSETQEKIKILENELEVLRRESLIKDQALKKAERDKKEHDQACKNLLVERNRWNKKLEGAKTKEEDLKRQMSKLNSVITTTEDEMLHLKKSYEDAVEKRNFTGIQLIDRNDELCILYEKANIQESVLKRGMKELNARDEDIRKMAIKLADVQRKIDLCQKVLPQVRDMEEDLAETMLALEEERWRAETL